MIYSAVVCTPNTIFLGHTLASSSVIIYSNTQNHSSNAVTDTNNCINPFVYVGQYLNIVGPANSLKLNGLADRLLVTSISGHFTILDSSHDMIERIRSLFQDHQYKQDYIPEAKRLGLVYHHIPQHLGQTDFASFLPDGRSLLVTGRTLTDGLYLFSCQNDSQYTREVLNLPLDGIDSFGQITDITISDNYLALASSTSHLLVIDYVKCVTIYSQKLSDTFAEITSLHWRPRNNKSSHLSLAAAMCDGFVKITFFKSHPSTNNIYFDTTVQYKLVELGTIRKVLCREYDILAAAAGNCLLDDKVIREDFIDGNKWQFSGINRTHDANQLTSQFGLILQRYKDGKTANERLSGHIHHEPILDFCVSGDMIISCSKSTVIASSGKLVFRLNS
ncbi:hypothetical protein BmR1_04g04915 [Babesia microti strain RI]|uniref:Uncharacterized protein n=1 Tax=Babesia microti (strain RI) TaxID=1133968 RepID=A0A1N6LX96_BABMR|nr:hypothetical protein BmR1_04g04915 [Babesia microti strain RI]SIO73495.1 hypothetical protein BmR1_04g04915 [Babesia microti strain RI]|eukprot:XP_021337591.1 hypothetical protein BmR1_04g04915 [Babesia microti strain RI]